MAQPYQARYVQAGESIDYTPGSDVNAGQVVVQNSLVGIAKTPISANRLGALAVGGVFDVVKVNGAINAGAVIYWDADGDPQGGTAGSGAATTTSTDNSFMGFALAAAGQTDEVVRILLIPVISIANTIHNALTAVIEDPGDAGAIPVTNTGSCSLVTGGAETRTLAAPTYLGQLLALGFKTDGGDCVVSASTAVNQTGNNTLTFADAGDQITLIGIELGAAKVWRVVCNDGVALSTV